MCSVLLFSMHGLLASFTGSLAACFLRSVLLFSMQVFSLVSDAVLVASATLTRFLTIIFCSSLTSEYRFVRLTHFCVQTLRRHGSQRELNSQKSSSPINATSTNNAHARFPKSKNGRLFVCVLCWQRSYLCNAAYSEETA